MPPVAARATGWHDALLYDSLDQLAAVAGPFLLEGLADGDAAVVAVAPERTETVRRAVDRDPRVRVLDRSAVYRRRTPATITAVRRLAAELTAAGARRLRLVGETDFGRTERERLEWQRYEAVVNAAMATVPVWGLCVFDTHRLPAEVLDTAQRAHRHQATVTGRVLNPWYREPVEHLADLPVPEVLLQRGAPQLRAEDVRAPAALRHAVAAALRALPGPAELLEDFLLAVDEMTTNAVRHGRPPVSLRLWTSAEEVVCTVRDAGPGPTDPFAGYGPAHGEDLGRGGMGLWLARQLCDHVDLGRDAAGCVVRLATRLR